MKNEVKYGDFVAGVVAAGGLMVVLDPDKCGNRRRALARDKAVRAEHVTERFVDKTVRDLQNRAHGIVAEAWARLREKEVPDDVLVQRVRSRLGRVVSHPHAIEVEAHDGVVHLRGPILAAEVEPLLRMVRLVRGVRGVENYLERHETPDSIPDLQGGRTRRPGPDIDVLQENWAPATRTLVGLSALGLLSRARRDSNLRLPLGLAGGALLFRAPVNMPLSRALGLDPNPRAILLQKTVNIHAPVEEIYKLFANPENFPLIFEHVNQVRHSRDNLYHWEVIGPAGTPVRWEAEVTENIPNQVIAWRSVPGSEVRTAGLVKFQRNPDGSTAVHIQFTYNPPAGVIGHAIAALFGTDPKHALDDDMARLKSLFEFGKTTVHGQRLTREEVERQANLR